LQGRQGFSLIELVIVVMIIGVLGAIAIPRLSRGSEGAAINAFVNEINTFAKLIDQVQLETGTPIADSQTGKLPSELVNYLNANAWESGTPLGGEWDIERDDSGVALAVGVHFERETPDGDALQAVDEMIDNGNLDTGAFRMIASGRYYLVLE
jgi:prepilin-type N-terminal cleavage/methylation domain-containing protein